jgi:membrane associated rhomboid family serine protease
MANIRGLYRNDPENQTPLLYTEPKGPSAFFSGSSRLDVDPRKESYFYMLRTNACWGLSLCSFTFIFAVIILLSYCAQLTIDGISKMQVPFEFLPIDISGPYTFKLLSSFNKIRNEKQIYRLLTSQLIHANLGHVVNNAIGLMIFGSVMSQVISEARITLIFIFAG